MMLPEQLYAHPNALAPCYKRFDVSERILLTGHSHQAWPDCAREGHIHAWDDAARYVDEKWSYAFEMAKKVERGFSRLLNDDSGFYTLGASTHDVLIRFLSALPLAQRRKLVTTTGEFHTIRRQLTRLEEEGIRVERIPSEPTVDVAERVAHAVDDQTAAVLISSVFYHNGQIVSGLGELLRACQRVGAELLIDAYHHLNVVPFSITAEQLEDAYIIGGGYKYCQLGEGNCFLRFPPHCRLRPIITGWFAEFDALEGDHHSVRVTYDEGPARFAGSTYDPTAHYRAATVFDFFQKQQLTPELLREVSQHQIGLLVERFDQFDLDPNLINRDSTVPVSRLGGFVSLTTPYASTIQNRLRHLSIYSDVRGNTLRLGPAPYLSDRQLQDALEALRVTVKSLGLAQK